MLDLLSPLRGYIAQNLQFYLGKYIEGIQLEGLGLFGGDLVLNDLEIKRHVLRESLEIPSSFDFSRGFIRELRIHIPWTQLLSQPIEVKVYTIELILTARSSTATPVSVGDSVAIETEIDQPKSGWIHDTLQKILANVSIQVNNLVLKYEHDDIVFSIALGALDFYSASEKNGWKRAFEELKTGRRIVCKGMDAKDVTIFLDRYTSEKNANKLTSQYSFRRKVVGYEVPILSRTSASMRAKVQLFSKAAVSGPLDQRSNPNSPLRQHHPDVNNCRKSIDLDKSFMHKPSVMYDPFYYYSCYRSSLSPVYEVDIFIGELVFSISDRQLEMLNQLLRSASYKLLQTHNSSSKIHNCGNNDDKPTAAGNTSAGPTFNYQMEAQEVNSNANKHVSWLSWVINALGTADNEQEDTLVTELLAETRAALLRGVSPGSKTGNDDYMSTTKTSCMRVFISSAILTLRKHEAGEHVENKDCMTTESREEFVPVANLGMVKVSVNARKNKIARPAVPILHSKLTYVVLELLLAREQERCGTNLVFEIEKVETMSATTSDNMDSVKYKKEEMLLTWGTTDNRCFYDCVSHPYFINSFFDEETVRLCERENRNLKTVKGRQNADIPVWKSLKADRKRKSSFDFANAQCECSMTWNGQTVRCIPVSTISEICQNLISSLKTKEQLLDNVILLNAASKAWALAGFATSFSQTFARALTAAAFEYQTHRNPGVGAQENLTQLLLPQLIAISCRCMLHHCPAASLSPSDKSDCWRRSIYSALRMRSAYIYDINESHVALPDLQRNNETVSNVLDVSFGAAQAVVDPAKCLIILESLSIFLPKNKNDLNNSIWICNEMSTPALKSVMPPKKSRNDVKLITGYYVHIRLPSSAGSGDTSVKIDACSDLNVSGSDFTWLGNFRTDSSDSRLQLGTLTAYLGGAQSKIAKVSLLELLEFDLSTLENCVDEGDSNEFLASLIKAKIDFSLPAIENITTSINRIARPLGYPIPWANTIFVPKQPQALFQIEICQISFSRIVISRPRLLMAQRQSFRGEISSVSATWKNKVEGSYKMILQGGAAAMPYKNSNVNSHLVQFEMVQEKSSGRLNGVPLLKSLGRFALISDLLTTTCAHCKVSVQGQLAHVHIDLCGLTQLTRKVCYLINTIIPSRDDLKYKLVRQEHCTQDDTIADRSLTGWNFTIDLKAGGADIRLNEALQLGILVLTLSSTENKADATDSVKSGGTLHLDFVSKGAVLYASKSGILMGLTDPLILNIDKVNVSAGFTHRLVNGQQTYATDVTLSASSMQASLSRLKLMYLVKVPFLGAFFSASAIDDTSHSQKGQNCDKGALCGLWYWRLGAQLDNGTFVFAADIYRHSKHKMIPFRAEINGKLHNISVAARISNQHPTRHHLYSRRNNSFRDIQLSVGAIQVVERHLYDTIRSKFGKFLNIPEHAFMNILVCMNLHDLKCLSKALRVSDTSMLTKRQCLPPAMLSWHLTSTITKMFQEVNTKCVEARADKKLRCVEAPLIVSCNDPAVTKHPQTFPLLSTFYRNYSEAGLPYHVFAGSIDSVDFSVSASSLYCLAAVFEGCNSGYMKPNTTAPEISKPADRQEPSFFFRASPPTVSLANVEVSLLLGQIRLILPNEKLMDYSSRSPIPGNICLVLESMSMASAVRNNISLEGLGYPPFNSRILPRRPTVQAKRFGQSQLRIACRAGKISGSIAEIESYPEIPYSASNHPVVGPFELFLSSVAGHSAKFANANAFWEPFNVTCSIEEECMANIEGLDGNPRTSASIALTKLRLNLHTLSADMLYKRYARLSQGIIYFRQSIQAIMPVELTPVRFAKISSDELTYTKQQQLAFSCDGIEVNVKNMDKSVHVRVGSIIIVHNYSTLSGIASIQNMVVGHRTDELETSSASTEEVIFGANVEPSLWQLAIENYPEKMVSARWTCGGQSERTFFLDVQSYQFHVSHHFIQSIAHFLQPQLYAPGFFAGKQILSKKSNPPIHRKAFVFTQRWSLKILVAPSVISFWRQVADSKKKCGVWIKTGQLFASIGIGIDEASLHLRSSAINEINCFVAIPTLKVMLSLDKVGLYTSDDMPTVEVRFQKSTVGSILTPTWSTYPQYLKYISNAPASQRLVQDCSFQVTGNQDQMVEQVVAGDREVCLLYTEIVRTTIQTEIIALCIKFSSFSLSALQSLLSSSETYSGYVVKGSSDSCNESDAIERMSLASSYFDDTSTDDFKHLKRMVESRRPLPGELVFTETLLIETQSNLSTYTPLTSGKNLRIHIDSITSDELVDVKAYLEVCNKPWDLMDLVSIEDRPCYTKTVNLTHGWMGMRWCYHMPRKIFRIVAQPVPIPPNGVPCGWPSYKWNQDQEDSTSRLCDIFCQLRYWDCMKSAYITVIEFYVPWEHVLPFVASDDVDIASELESFGNIVSQWFDVSIEQTRHHEKMLDLGALARTYTLENDISSEIWELRWKAPLHSEQELENKQKRLVVNALLASSLRLHSILTCDTYQSLVLRVTFSQVLLSASHFGSENDTCDIITAELNDTDISCGISGGVGSRCLSVQVSSVLQVYLNNIAQLLTVLVIPRTTIDAMIEFSSKGFQVSTLVGPVSLYLNRTSMLVLSAIPKLLQNDLKSSKKNSATNPDEDLSSMRIKVVNQLGVDVWYRQEGTFECLHLKPNTTAAYSWLSLASIPFYQLSFALNDPRKKISQESSENYPWCDPCRIKDNDVTGRYFGGHGFIWVCVELMDLQTLVTLRSSLTFSNYCDFSVSVKVNEEAYTYNCEKRDEFYREHAPATHHLHCISLDGSACTLLAKPQSERSVARIMAESVAGITLAFHGGSSCDIKLDETLPTEFDLVKISDYEAQSLQKSQYQLTILQPQNHEEPTHYAWTKFARAQCKTVLPNDFDFARPQVSGRYTWMEMSLWPAISVSNMIDTPVELHLSQEQIFIDLKLCPTSNKRVSTINPFESIIVILNCEQDPSDTSKSPEAHQFLLQCCSVDDRKDQVFDFEDCKVVANFHSDRGPVIQIRIERILSIANMTPSDLNVKVGSSFKHQDGALEVIFSGVEKSIGFAAISNCLVIAIAITEAPSSVIDQLSWSPDVLLDVKGDIKPTIIPSSQAKLRNLASAYCIELVNSGGYLKVIIRPLVVVINATDYDLKCVPTDGQRQALAEDITESMVLGCNAGWSVPVCLLKQASERNITADVKSWLSSKLTRHPSVSKVEYNEAKQESMATLSCSFRITLAEDGYRWTEEIAVMLPKIYFGLASDGKSLTSSSAPANVLKNLYPSPSTTTYRRRLLIRHHAFRHKMLTYTITQRGSSIHVLFFEDHQPPLIIHNQWQHLLAIRNVSFPSDPEGIGSNFYLEYDWSLQAIAKQHCLESKELLANNEKTDAESLHFSEWLEASSLSQDRSKMPRSNSKDRTRYQIGSPQYGWSNSLWQIGGIQFASLTKNEGSALAELGLTFLIMSFYRAGSWLISITCLEDPSRDSLSTSMPPLVVPSVASLMPLNQSTQSFLKVGVILDKFLLHFCDEHDTVRDATGMMFYPDILQFSCDDVSIIFNTAPDPPEASRHNSRLGYLSHIRSYTSLYISIEHIEVGHFVQACNFPLLLSFRKTHKDNNLLQLDRVRKHERLSTLTQKLLNKKLPKSAESPCITTRIIFADTWDSITTPSFYHSIELKISPAIIQVEDDILTHLNAFIQPFFAAREGKALCRAMNESFIQTTLQNTDAWSLHAYESSVITKQRKVYIEWLKISDVQVTITARVSIPVLNSFDCTPLHFGSTKMREVFSFPDQLYKDVAANYVVDTIVCSPMLLMSLNILGNPAGFLRRFGQGVKDLVEIPLTASRNGYNPWTLTKGVAGGFTSFLSHTAAAVLTSVSGFTYSISRTMDQVTLPADQLRKRHYSRPTHLSSAVADGLESLGSSFVGAATGLVTTPIAIYKERQMQGLDTGFRNVVGSVGMGLVGIVAQPVGGIASLVSMTSDGLLYGLKENRAKLHDSPSRVNARPNELLRYKLKVLSNAFESYLVFAHGVWIIPDENSQLVLEHQAECIIEEKPKSPENDSLRGLLLPRDVTRPLAQVTVVCSKELVYVVGVTKAQNQVVLIRTSLKSIEAVEESLQEPTMFDLGIKTSSSAEWLHFRLPPQQRRHLSHHLRLLLAGDASIQV